ncbi:MAG TPA: pyridoxal-dependent decarboxylase, partial [Chitinophagaceae bacterium]|nr:pyridoxal-dependent decarboxylase [Chitinophagaceae bacterium]
MPEYNLLDLAAQYSKDYLGELKDKRVFPSEASLQELQKLSIPLPSSPTEPKEVLELLNTIGSKNTVTSNGSRYFGFVFGGTLPASLAASWMVTTWDQNGVFKVSSPIGAHIERVAGNWLLDLLRLPAQSAVGFVTGTTMANFCGALAARYHLCKRKGYDIKRHGLNGAPPIKVVVGEEVHASMQRA